MACSVCERCPIHHATGGKKNGAWPTLPQGISVTLRPRVTIAEGDAALAAKLHEDVGDRRFIARSVRFPIRHEPMMRRAPR